MNTLSILSVAIGIISLIIGIFLSIKGWRFKRPKYFIRSNNLIQNFEDKLSGLVINYKGEPVKNLTVTKIAFWNHGRETINYSDIPDADPIRIEAKGDCKILHAEIIWIKNSANKFKVSEIDNYKSVKILFDYLDKNEGGIIQIVHTGKSSKDIEIKGCVKGGKPVKLKTPIFPVSQRIKEMISGGYWLGIIYILFFIFPKFVIKIQQKLNITFKQWHLVFIYIVGGFLLLFISIYIISILFFPNLPRGFDIIEREE